MNSKTKLTQKKKKQTLGYENNDPAQLICHKKKIVMPGQQYASLVRMNQEMRPN